MTIPHRLVINVTISTTRRLLYLIPVMVVNQLTLFPPSSTSLVRLKRDSKEKLLLT